MYKCACFDNMVAASKEKIIDYPVNWAGYEISNIEI